MDEAMNSVHIEQIHNKENEKLHVCNLFIKVYLYVSVHMCICEQYNLKS